MGRVYLTTLRIIFVPSKAGRVHKEFWVANQGMVCLRFSGASSLAGPWWRCSI